MSSKDTIERLNEALNRLMEENAQLRRKIEEVDIVIRRRAPNADGLTLLGALKTILNDRDNARSRIQFFRDELKKVMKILINGNAKEALKEINHFLFNNPR